ncbi:MAG: PQQ-binding-like beta-propeller repeat protein [Candidatus Cybelea sp.]
MDVDALRVSAALGSIALAGCQGASFSNPNPAAPFQSLQAAHASGSPQSKTVDWPQFRFDDARTGVNPHESVLGKKTARRMQLLWEAALGYLVDYSSPAVVDGVVYVGSSDGRIWAYPADGCGQFLCIHPLWQSTSFGQIIDSPTVANGFVYVGSQTSYSSNHGKLDVFSAKGCGQDVCPPLWQGLAGSQAILESSPAVAHGRVYVGGYDHNLYVFDAMGCGSATCAPVWTAPTGGSIESSPTVVKNTVYVGSDDGKLYAFDARGCHAPTCSPLWSGTLRGPAFSSSPAVVNGVVYIGSDHALSAFKSAGCGRKSCEPLWQSYPTSLYFNGSPAVHNGRVYIGLEYGVNAYAANGCGKKTCVPLWSYFGSGEQADVISSPTIANGVLYAGRNTGEVLAWKEGPCEGSCSEIWHGKTNEQIVTSSPTVVNGRLYIGSADYFSYTQGRIYVFGLLTSKKQR